jgi:glycosyltransferase involved in cell wall biosynthesis
MEAAKTIGKRYVVILQGNSELLWPEDDLAEKLAINYENAEATFCVSEATLNLCRRQFGTPLRRGRVIRNPFNVNYDARPAWPVTSNDGLSLACVARLHAVTKGQDLLLSVLSRPRWRERNVRVSLVGEGPNEHAFRFMVRELKLTNISFLGHRTDIEKIWSEHQALVLPTRMEGMPLVVVEAMLCGRSCIATDVGGCRELISDGTNGFLISAPTVDLLDETLNRVWEGRNSLVELGNRAAVDVRKWVSRDPVADFAEMLEAS